MRRARSTGCQQPALALIVRGSGEALASGLIQRRSSDHEIRETIGAECDKNIDHRAAIKRKINQPLGSHIVDEKLYADREVGYGM